MKNLSIQQNKMIKALKKANKYENISIGSHDKSVWRNIISECGLGMEDPEEFMKRLEFYNF